MRNTPFLVQLFIIFFGLPAIGIRMSANQAALLAMVLNLAAYSTEIIRAGVESIHKSQIEAGLSLAMTRLQVFRSEEHTSELQSLMRNSNAVFCLKNKKRTSHMICRYEIQT